MSMMQRSRFALLLAVIFAAAATTSAKAQENASAPEFEPPPPPPDEEAQPEAAPSAEPPPQAPDERTFESQLSPYGRWIDTPEYGRVWQPAGVGSDWQPYADGQWVNTSYGWSFASPAPWGWAAYHYGRWGWRAGFGWFWVPGFTWAPAWVSWRWVNGYACWSPLAPRGFVYGRHWPGWVVVPHAHFAHPIRRWIVPRARINVIVRSARPVRGFPGWHARAFAAPARRFNAGGQRHEHGGGHRR
jgi:uncharacterized protein DUF6600